MKDYLNRKEYPNGDITVKLVKMGMDIDDTRNHRVRGIIQTEDNKNLFIEILLGRRIPKKYTSMTSKEYLEKYPNEEYICINGCFRVDIPEDYYKSYTSEFSKYKRYSFNEYKHNKENIIKVLQIFNKNIKDVELVDHNYMDEYCNENGFYELYDERLEHTLKPIKIINIYHNEIIIELEYRCINYDKTKTYTENIQRTYDLDLDKLNKKFGSKEMKLLLSDYERKLEKKNNLFKNEKKEMQKELEDKNTVQISNQQVEEDKEDLDINFV